MDCMEASTFWQARARGRSVAETESGERQLGVEWRGESRVEAKWTASMRRGMVRAANMSPVPEKKRGSWGVSMRKRRGLWSEVAVEPMMVRFSMSSESEVRGVCWDLGRFSQVEGWEVAASWAWVFEGVWVPVPAFDTGLEDTVWLSRVKRSDVMITCGTWYFVWSTWIAAARDLRSVIGVSESSL